MNKFFIISFFILVSFFIPQSVFAIEIPVIATIATENSSGYICAGNSIGCSSLNCIYKVKKYDEDTIYICSGNSVNCSFANDLYRIEIYSQDTIYICSGNSSSCSSFNDLYKIKKYNEDTSYICSGNSFGCSSFNDLYRIKNYDDNTTYVCSGDSFSCSSFSDLYRIERYDKDTTYICSGDSLGCSLLNNLYRFEKDSNINSYYNPDDDSLLCPLNSEWINGECVCNEGYIKYNSECITHTENCKKYYGENVYGMKGDNKNSSCYCLNGYEWNIDKTSCVKKTESILIPEGALIRAIGDIDVYIVKYVGAKKFKRLILSPSVFNNYGHLRWEDIMIIDQSIVNSFTTSELVRSVNDHKVYKLYPQGDAGQKRWIKNYSVFARMGFDTDSIYEINEFDRNSYITGTDLE